MWNIPNNFQKWETGYCFLTGTEQPPSQLEGCLCCQIWLFENIFLATTNALWVAGRPMWHLSLIIVFHVLDF